MGDLQSQPLENQQLRQLEQQYQPFSKGKHIPGQPLYLKLNSIFQKSEYCDKINNRFKKIERYQVFMRYSEQALQQDRNVYDYRRTNLPCIVQVVYYCLDQEDCECSSNAYRFTVYTEHVETRLVNYKTTKKVRNVGNETLQYYDPLTMDEAIYVLISTLHAYELLIQQFSVNYPSPFSIGINYKAQVKVWISDNWSVNQESHRRLSQGSIIEEIINIVQERMEDSFANILNPSANYMHFTFTAIQEILSRYTVNYQKGKKSLEDRLNNRVFMKEKDKSNIFSEKIPVGKSRQSSMHTNSNIVHTIPPPIQVICNPQNDKNNKPPLNNQNQRRYFSQQVPKKSEPFIPPSPVRNQSINQRTTVYESPKKIIKFVYAQSATHGQSPKISTNASYQRVSAYPQPTPASPAQSKFSMAEHKNKPVSSPQPINIKPNFIAKTVTMHSNISADYFDKNTISNLIDKKLKTDASGNPTANKTQTPNYNLSYKRQSPSYARNVQYSFDKYPRFSENIPANITINPFQILPREEKKVHFDVHDELLKKSMEFQKKSSKQLNKTAENASLSEITEQFKTLLKSDHKIQQKQELFYDYKPIEPQPHNTEKQPAKQQLQNSNSESRPYVHSFYEIKQEDQDVSYSIDEHV